VQEMMDKKYIDKFNANGSHLFWAPYGSRTDGRDNGRRPYQASPPDYGACGSSGTNLTNCGYKFSSVHESLNLYDGSKPAAAAWVYRLVSGLTTMRPSIRTIAMDTATIGTIRRSTAPSKTDLIASIPSRSTSATGTTAAVSASLPLTSMTPASKPSPIPIPCRTAPTLWPLAKPRDPNFQCTGESHRNRFSREYSAI